MICTDCVGSLCTLMCAVLQWAVVARSRAFVAMFCRFVRIVIVKFCVLIGALMARSQARSQAR